MPRFSVETTVDGKVIINDVEINMSEAETLLTRLAYKLGYETFKSTTLDQLQHRHPFPQPSA